MTTAEPTIDANLVRSIGRDLLHAAATFGPDGADIFATATAVTQMAPEAPVWQVIATAATLVRSMAGRSGIDDATDDELAAAQLLRELRKSIAVGQFERKLSFADARIMTALLAMADVAAPGNYEKVIDLAVAWEERWTVIDAWQITYFAVQLIRQIAEWSDDPMRLLSRLIDELHHRKEI